MSAYRVCANWKSDLSKGLSCEGVVLDSGEGEFIVKGQLSGIHANPTVLFWAPNPPTYNCSFSGSGLPYPNADVAFENSPNRGAVKAPAGQFEFKVRYPNSYYIGLGSLIQCPAVFIKVCDQAGNGEIQKIELGASVPYRSLTYPPIVKGQRGRSDAMFYVGRDALPHRTQEQILRDSGYPAKNVMAMNFWGLRPPQ